MVLIDVYGSKGVTGKEAEYALDEAGITVNKNMIPDDPRSPMDPSGIRVGVQAVTSRGMKETEIKMIAGWIDEIILSHKDEKMLAEIRKDVVRFCKKYPIYPTI